MHTLSNHLHNKHAYRCPAQVVIAAMIAKSVPEMTEYLFLIAGHCVNTIRVHKASKILSMNGEQEMKWSVQRLKSAKA